MKLESLQEKLGRFEKVTDKGVNYAVIRFENGEIMQSYSSIVGARVGCKYYFGALHDCSVTTSRQMKGWCGMTATERRNALESGIAERLE